MGEFNFEVQRGYLFWGRLLEPLVKGITVASCSENKQTRLPLCRVLVAEFHFKVGWWLTLG